MVGINCPFFRTVYYFGGFELYCCGIIHVKKNSILKPTDEFMTAEMDYSECVKCGNAEISLKRKGYDGKDKPDYSETGKKARKLHDKLKSQIIPEYPQPDSYECAGLYSKGGVMSSNIFNGYGTKIAKVLYEKDENGALISTGLLHLNPALNNIRIKRQCASLALFFIVQQKIMACRSHAVMPESIPA